MIISLASSWPGFLHNGVIDPSGVGSSAPGADDGLHLFITHDIKTDQHWARGDGTTAAAGQIIEPSEDMLLLKYLTFRVKFKHFPKIDSDIINGQF